MDQFYKIYQKNHYKKRLHPPRDSHFLKFINFSHIHFVILQHYGVILTKLITNLDEFYICQYKKTIFFQKKRQSLLKMDFAKFVQKTIKKRAVSPAGQSFFEYF